MMTKADEYHRYRREREILAAARQNAKPVRRVTWVDAVFAGLAVVAVAACFLAIAA